MKKTLLAILLLAAVLASLCVFAACQDVGNVPNNTGDGEKKARFYTDDTLSPYVLTSEQEQSARQQYLQMHPSHIREGATIENVAVRKCCGQVNDKIVLSFDWILSDNFLILRISVPYWPIKISDVPIDLMQDLALLYNGKVYTLEDAFEQNVINHSELVAIAYATWAPEVLERYFYIGENLDE